MNFQDLKKVEKAQFYVDLAFRKSREAAKSTRSEKFKSIDKKSKSIEQAKISTFKQVLTDNLDKIIKSFPNTEGLPEFYQEMIKCCVDYNKLKKSLGAVNWAKNMITEIYRKQSPKLKYASKVKDANEARNHFFGRASSIVNQINSNLVYLEQARKIMKEFPSIKQKMYTIAIAGFPNVGKTTLLSKLTESRPEIAAYAFTTKQINVGYMKTDYGKMQFLDTPGTLNRFNAMNNIEKQAYLAIKYCADLVIYVFDLTESSYSLDDQLSLLKSLEKFDKEILIYLSKTDILSADVVDEFRKKHKVMTDIEVMSNIILKKEKDWSSLN